jgi:hypothetical protein
MGPTIIFELLKQVREAGFLQTKQMCRNTYLYLTRFPRKMDQLFDNRRLCPPCLVLCKSSILDSHDATSLFDFPSFFYLSKGQEREAHQYTKLHIDRKYQEEHRSADRGNGYAERSWGKCIKGKTGDGEMAERSI